jgi:DNA-binding beta-propeller fold protein YncE
VRGWSRPRVVVGAGALATVLTAAAAAALATGVIGPDTGITGNGRLHTFDPSLKLVAVGNFPTGGAVTPDGRYYLTVSTGRGGNDIRIVDLANDKVQQVIPIPGGSGGIAMSPTQPLAFVSGVADSSHADEQQPGLPGRGGDVVEVFSYDRHGNASFVKLLPVPAPPGTAPAQDFPPSSKVVAWPDRLAVSPDGSKLLVPLNLADAAAVVDTTTGATSYVRTGSYPYGAAITPDGRSGLVTNEAAGTVSFVDLATATKTGDVALGHLTHPEGITIDAEGRRAYVAVANDDRVAVIDLGTRTLAGSWSTARSEGAGTSPTALALAPDGSRLYVAESSADELAVFDTADGSLVGRIPTAAYPTDVRVTPNGKTLVWLTGKGLGSGPNPNGPNPFVTNDDNSNSFQYLPLFTFGDVGVQKVPNNANELARLTAAADAQIVPANAEAPPADTPLRADGPIKHVFYIVRENRTYDQVLGDDPRGDGDPSLTLFGRQRTPNIHALVERFPLLDHVYADSEASIQGHYWTSAASVSDYVEKNWWQNYAGRGRPADFDLYSVSFPQRGYLFDQATRDGVSWFDYGEVAGNVPAPFVHDKDLDPATGAGVLRRFAGSDLGPAAGGCYANVGAIGTDPLLGLEVFDSSKPAGAPPGSLSRADCFRARLAAQVAAGAVPAFNYLVLTNDHTRGVQPGARTPYAMVADNDLGLGQVVDAISHSPIWSSSAIFVVEDDSQDGADHVDAHRTVAAVISPYAKYGAVIHTRYDQLSIDRSIELILGMHPLGLLDAVATPMYDAFTSTPVNDEPFTALPETTDLLARNPSTAFTRRMTAGLDFTHIDAVPQHTFDNVLWKYVHGASSIPPPPGPNADDGPDAADGDA